MRVQDLFDILKENQIYCFTGVPDSLLKDFCAYVTDNVSSKQHTIAANEGNAIAIAAGHFLATGNPALVYMQNSGIGNCVNPLLSLIDDEVYSIPLLMLIGWRGEPNKQDEPQHVKQGKVTDKLLDAMGVNWEILENDFSIAKPQIIKAIQYIKENNKPFAFIVKKGLFEKYELQNKKQNSFELKREEAIEIIVKHLNFNDVIVSTTGQISREVYEIREKYGQSHKQDFLTVGSMGHASSIALGIALQKPDRAIYCFDGDGAFLMHQGAVIVNASKNLSNFKHIVFNNEAHDSVGAQPTAVTNAKIFEIALNSGYKKAYVVDTGESLKKILPEFMADKCMSLLEIRVKCGARANLGRPKEKPQENKRIFMANLNQVDFCYRGAIENLSKIVSCEMAKNILIFRGANSYSHFKNIIESKLKKTKIQYYSDFSVNPKKEDLEIAIDRINKDFDLIIAIGGGSVIDFAKLYKYITKSKKKLIAIPTTAGTGAEATQFAVLYINGEKTSVEDRDILPDYAIIDSQFVEHNSKKLKAVTAMDAYCQAIESYWSVKSTSISRDFAKRAILLCKENIVKYVNSDDIIASDKMMLASNLAGKAINISRTTVAHALSYKMTSEYNIPHGQAVALTIANLFKANLEINKSNCLDPRGVDFIQKIMSELKNLINKDIDSYFKDIFIAINLKTDFKIDVTNIINSVNIERLNNNPRKMTRNDLKRLFYKCNINIK